MKTLHLLKQIMIGMGMIAVSGCATTTFPKMMLNSTQPMAVLGDQPFAYPRDILHTVGPSETLWRISRTYGVDMPTLLLVNELQDPTKIRNGQELLVPNTKGPRPLIPLYPTWRWTHIVIHHTATHEGDAHSIDRLHHKRGFHNGLGYHFLIDNGTSGKADGQIEVGPRWIKQMDGAHANANGMNQSGIGIALVGNYSRKRVSERELESMVFLVKVLQEYYQIPPENVIGHRDVPGKTTECPGLKFPWQQFKRRLGSRLPQLKTAAYMSAPGSSKRISSSDSLYFPRALTSS